MDQLKACNFTTLKQQMRFKTLLKVRRQIDGSSSHDSSGSDINDNERKFKLKELGQLSPEDRRIYLMA